ncbi:MAG: glycoside hydrolase family 5 protein [Chthoniobacteraceae bacterium]
MKRIANWGFDHIRLPIDEQQMWNDSGEKETEAFDLMDSALDWAEEAGLKVIIDLHILRSHFFISTMEPKLFTDPAEAQKFSDLWRQLSDRLKCRANDRVAYELLNEAVATDPQDWNRVAMGAFQTIRELEPDRVIVLGSNHWNSALTFDDLHVPDDKNTILTFHFYHPMLVTHHRAQWCAEGRMYDGLIQYPGRPIPDEHAGKARLPEDVRLVKLKMEDINKPYDRNSMVADMAKPIAAAEKNGLPLYCGEFGVINLAPQPVRHAWYRDIISVFNEYGIGWANWDYKGTFGIVEKNGQSTGIAEAMLSVS